MTAPYDLKYVDTVYKYVKAYKIGSGDINWREIVDKIARKNKPIILATGASNFEEVKKTVELIKKKIKNLYSCSVILITLIVKKILIL